MTAVLGTDLILRCIAMLFFAANSNLSRGWTIMIMMYHLEWSFSWHLRSCLYSRCSWRPVCTQMSPSASGPWGPGLCGLCQVGQGAGIGRLLGRIFQRKRTAKPGGSACRWMWMAVDGCGIFWDFRDAFGGGIMWYLFESSWCEIPWH